MKFNSVIGMFSIIMELTMIVLNMLPIYVGLWFKRRNDISTLDELIIALSCATIGVVLFSTPFGLMTYFNHVSSGGMDTCTLYQASTTWYQMFTILLLSTLSLHQIHHGSTVSKFHYPPRVWTRRTTIVLLVVIILLGMYVAALPLAGMVPPHLEQTSNETSCRLWLTLDSTVVKEKVFCISYLSIGYANMMCVCFGLPFVFYLVRKVKYQMRTEESDQETTFVLQRDIHRRSYIISSRLVSVLVAIFYFSWTPVLVMVTIRKLGANISETAILYAMLGTSLTGVLNPLVYAFLDERYRRGYKHALQFVTRLFVCKHKVFRPVAAVTMEYTVSSGTQNSGNYDDPTFQPREAVERMRPLTSEQGHVNTACDDIRDVAICPLTSDVDKSSEPLCFLVDQDCGVSQSPTEGDRLVAEKSCCLEEQLDDEMAAVFDASLGSSPSDVTSEASLELLNDRVRYEESVM